jgi:5-methyltetrahydrofolate--homocysteine methyltransferase
MDIRDALKYRVLVLDGAMGTMIQKFWLTEADFRGERFKNAAGTMKGNNDALSITKPDIIEEVHCRYLEAGADIISTNTFGANRISMADYWMEGCIREMNLAAVAVARKAADEFSERHRRSRRFVAGSIGPTNRTASISPDVMNPAFRAVTFDELRDAYREQIDAFIEGGVDAVLFETCFDTLNLKAGLMAANEAFEAAGREIPLMVSFTIGDKSGRILSGQTLEAAVASIAHVNLLSIGLNCSFGAKQLKPYIRVMGKMARCFVSAHPNAGLPNALGEYDETPKSMAAQIKEYIDEGLVNIIGGCCGTTPDHIAAIAKIAASGRVRYSERESRRFVVSGLEPYSTAAFTKVGERCNVAGSRKFLRLIREKKYDDALDTARSQIEHGAHILDINVDDGLIDGVEEMTTFLNLIASEPDVARAPVMIDSSDWNVIEAGLKCVQGKCIVNSISLKNGEADFLNKAKKIRAYGAAVVAMAFDEQGQAESFERKREVCKRMYSLLTEKAKFNPNDIIFDPNILSIATGIEEHNNYAVNFIRATEWIKRSLPGAKVSGGVSNLSFSFRGNTALREAMHAVFLYHAVRAGMDMGIVDPESNMAADSIPYKLRILLENVILNSSADAVEKLMEHVNATAATGSAGSAGNAADSAVRWRKEPLNERLKHAMVNGISEFLEEDLQEALKVYRSPAEIIDGPLMEGINTAGNLFGEGKMFLPQVVKSARTMKRAVSFLQPHIEAGMKAGSRKAGKILLATVRGDVHDIGKNITSVVLSCNNCEVIDMGVMIPAEDIVNKAIETGADIIGLSGLITPSLNEMAAVAQEMEKTGLKIPLMVGGATTSRLHTALKIAPVYSGAVIQVADASRAVPAVSSLLNAKTKDAFIAKIKDEQQAMRDKQAVKPELVSLEYARKHPYTADFSKYVPPKPSFTGNRVVEDITVGDLAPYIDWNFLLSAWDIPQKSRDAAASGLLSDAREMLSEWVAGNSRKIRAVVGFYPVMKDGDSLILDHGGSRAVIPFLRQQEKREDDVYKSLVDFIHPAGDYIGLFVVTAGEGAKRCDCGSKHDTDDYRAILEQTLMDRLAEAAAEYLHALVRKKYWGYEPEVALPAGATAEGKYRGIRPASGYPACPDLSLNFTLNEILEPAKIGVGFTANGAITPLASVAGFYFANPEAKYFHTGRIDGEQLRDYSAIKGFAADSFLASIISLS